MRLILKILGAIVLLLVVIVGGIMITLNTGAGQQFAVNEINRLEGPRVHLAGLGGRFPGDIKLRDVQLADAKGVWLNAEDIELRWRPLALIHHYVGITSLTVARVNMLRRPVPTAKKKKRSSSSGGLHGFRIGVNRLEIGLLSLAPGVAGEAVKLHVQGAAHIRGPSRDDARLNATTPNGRAQYHLNAVINHAKTDIHLHVAEPPNGLIGHFAGPRVHAPLNADLTVAGPRNDAALNFVMALGAAKLSATGTVGLVPKKEYADLAVTIPELAPFSAFATTKTIGGSAQLHLRAAAAKHHAATLALTGYMALTQAPAKYRKLLGPKDEISLQARLAHGVVTIKTLHLAGDEFAVDLRGKVSKKKVALTTSARLDQVAALSPRLSGHVAAKATIKGPPHDFAVHADLTGVIGAKGEKSGSFNVTINMRHLPKAATGTLVGGGMLESAPLRLNAAFSRAASGAVQLNIKTAKWRSASVTADLHLARGAVLPRGSATFSIVHLKDFSAFVPLKLHGAVNGDFAYQKGQTVKLDVTAKNLLVNPSLGTINGTVAANGPVRAVAVKTHLAMANLKGHPARLDSAGVLDMPARTGRLTRLDATWQQLIAKLQGPADIAAKPDVTVQHLKLALNGGTVAINGTLSPRLNAKMVVHNLPMSIANAVKPSLGATGTINADARLTGTRSNPGGTIILHLSAIHLAHGPAAALAPADVNGKIKLAGTKARLNLALKAGPDIAFVVKGMAPLKKSGTMNLHAQGQVNLRLLNLYLAAKGTSVRGKVLTDMRVSGTLHKPDANGTVTLNNGSIENIGTGLNLTQIHAAVLARGRDLIVQKVTATAGKGTVTIQGRVRLAGKMPVSMTVKAANASIIASDLITEKLNADLALSGAVHGGMKMAGNVDITRANINIPKSLPPSVAKLNIVNVGQKPPPPPAPAPPVALDITVKASKVFVRGDGLLAQLGGQLHIGGTMAAPNPVGHFNLVRGNFALAGKSLKFTSGDISFNGNGFVPSLHLVASASSSSVSNATLTVEGTAAKPVITLSSSPPLPSDEILAQLLFGVSTANLTPFQAVSLAASLAKVTGIGPGIGGGVSNPLDKVRNALGLDELSIGGGTGSGLPSVHAGRYVAPGVYVGATQATNGQGTQVNVEVNLAKGLKLKSATGTSSTGGNASSVGLSYQFNY